MTERILVIKLGALGDFIYALGPMRAVREHHGNARLTLLTQKSYAALAEKTGLFDEIMLDLRPKYNPSDWLDFRNFLNKKNFTRVYDLQNNDRTSLYFKLFYPKPEWVGAVKGASHRNRDPDRIKFHAFAGHRNTLRLGGIDKVELDDLSWMTSDISRFDIPKPYILLVPGSAPSRPDKRWPVACFRSLVEKIIAAGLRPVLLGSNPERELAGEISQGLAVTNLAGQTSLDDIPELARGAACAVGNDTGPMHMISMTGCPSLLFFRSDESTVQKHGPQNPNALGLEASKLEDIEVQDVFDKMLKMIRR